MQSGWQTAVQVLAIPPPSCNPIAVRELLVGILHDVSRAHQRFWENMHTTLCVCDQCESKCASKPCERVRSMIKKVDFLSIGNFVEKCQLIIATIYRHS
jgi:hypothetical protein